MKSWIFRLDRKLKYNFFKDTDQQAEIATKGYTIIRNCIKEDELNYLEETYKQTYPKVGLFN